MDPICIRDIAEFFLGNKNKKEAVRKKELMIRTSLGYVNESATMFEFLMLYIKIWKIACYDRVIEKHQVSYEIIYNFMCDLESMVYDLSKSVLIDASTLKYKGSLIVASLISVSLDLFVRLTLPNLRSSKQPLAPHIFDQIKMCIEEWDHILERLFGQGDGAADKSNSIAYHFSNFGRYIMRR